MSRLLCVLCWHWICCAFGDLRRSSIFAVSRTLVDTSICATTQIPIRLSVLFVYCVCFVFWSACRTASVDAYANGKVGGSLLEPHAMESGGGGGGTSSSSMSSMRSRRGQWSWRSVGRRVWRRIALACFSHHQGAQQDPEFIEYHGLNNVRMNE